MMNTHRTRLWSIAGLIPLAAALSTLAGCVVAADPGEPLGEAAQALDTPNLVATPSSLDFGRVAVGSSLYLRVTLTNRGTGTASRIAVVPPDPYIPPDPYHNPPADLPAGSSEVIAIGFAPTARGTFSASVRVNYYDDEHGQHSMEIAVTGDGV